MLDRIMFYIMFAGRGLIWMVALIAAATILMYITPNELAIMDNVVDLRPAKEILYLGSMGSSLITFVSVWVKDYQDEHIPNWLR